MDIEQYLGAEKHRSIEIEISTRCTIMCRACPRMYQDRANGWDTGFMDIDVFKDIVNNSNYQVYQLVGAYGDAIYHPQILEIVEFLLKTDKKFFIETNGAHKKKEFWDKWIQLPWRRQALMVWSIDGLEDTNHLYRRNSNWESIMYGVKTILDMPRNKRPGMKWKYLVFPYNEHQVDEARTFSQELGFDQFEPYKSLRKYNTEWFKDNPTERKLIDWNEHAN